MKKKGVVPILLVVLAVSTVGLAAFSVQAVATIKSSNNQMAGLNSTVSSLKNDMATMRTLTSGLSPGQESAGTSDRPSARVLLSMRAVM